MNLKDVAVLIPYFNDLAGINKTLESITETVDVIIVDDGSERALVASDLFLSDFRKLQIKIIRLDVNQGIVTALNAGLEYIDAHSYRYVARLDSGDTVIGKRFGLQKNHLKENPSVKLVGGWANFVDESGKLLFQLKHPLQHDRLVSSFFKFNPFLHPTVMFDICIFKKMGGYPSDFEALEDYAYFWSVAKCFEVANIPIVMLNYEVSNNSISSKKRLRQSMSKIKLILRNFDFSTPAFYGLLKSLALILLPRDATTWMKKILWK